jgi:hypothetical protein
MSKPFNALFDVKKPKEVSRNEMAEKVVGQRKMEGVISIDEPCELGYHCPVCKYEQEVDGTYDERLIWSEYNTFLYCYVCNRDYPSALCMPDIESATRIYLECIQDAQEWAANNKKVEE